jgi:DNA helicase II / ATP-dependent DNA helicase PcrA
MAVDVHHIGSDLELEFSDDFNVREDAIEALRSRIHSAPIAVSAALQSSTATSDEYQARVIDAKGKTIRLVAPAGSGKTQTMINRVLR